MPLSVFLSVRNLDKRSIVPSRMALLWPACRGPQAPELAKRGFSMKAHFRTSLAFLLLALFTATPAIGERLLDEGSAQQTGAIDGTVLDPNGDPVAGAVVTGSFTGSLTESVSATTSSNGSVVLETTATKKGGLDLSFCVDVVQAAGLTYQPSSNIETCDTN